MYHYYPNPTSYRPRQGKRNFIVVQGYRSNSTLPVPRSAGLFHLQKLSIQSPILAKTQIKSIMTDYVQEQEMEIEALEAILMDEFREIDSSESGLTTSNRCFQIVLSPQDDNFDESSQVPVQLALIFSHTEKYPDEPPLLNVKSIKGIRPDDLALLKEKLQNEAEENLGMAMIYTLATSAKEWLTEKFCGGDDVEESEETGKTEDEVIVPHGEAVTVESFLAWRERFEAELALERAKLMPESALTAPKEKKLTGRQWFESGRHTLKGAAVVADGSEEDEDEEDIDFDEDFEDDDEEDMLEHYLAEKTAGGSTK
ncbi:RWD domain-containing protein 1 [Rhynchospora pubera]|uniref:RWD domain-containing protein 1 n=2 Tax=Rhynchospora pubera TaxID=906938 RepID=A0AAV8FZE6_9POAL|nr:RWD domain-containing protein 1 [Rhynchospora pubera]